MDRPLEPEEGPDESVMAPRRGRPRRYANAAEKQRAYRQRRAVRIAAQPKPLTEAAPAPPRKLRTGRELLEERRLQRDIAPFAIVWPTAADCGRALATFAQGYLRHGLGLLDSVIGECAVGLGAVLCTFNVRHFRAVPGLVTEQPYRRRNV